MYTIVRLINTYSFHHTKAVKFTQQFGWNLKFTQQLQKQSLSSPSSSTQRQGANWHPVSQVCLKLKKDFIPLPFMRAAESLVCHPWQQMAFSLRLAGTTQTISWLEPVGPSFSSQASGTARHQHGCPHYKSTLPRRRGPAPNSNSIFPQIIIIVLLSPAYLFLSFSALCHS